MANKKFTAREMDALRESPYVLDISPSIVHFYNTERYQSVSELPFYDACHRRSIIDRKRRWN
ncbi:MAG: HTH domain-containing protein [Lawsonibacter sp.]|nr:HTH domain-containing protein [Lawsonibacter sp.]